jgi:mono/diheme cytochrome c family protein
MNPPPADLTLTSVPADEKAVANFRAIRDGKRGTAMTSWPMLSDQQVWNVVSYIHSLRRR